MSAVRHLSNRAFRRVLLSLNGLAPPHDRDTLPHGRTTAGSAWTNETVRRLGFVQVDPICAVERAHHHILFSRNPRYRQDSLSRLLEQDRRLFENWTRDAAILPVESFPYWRHFFERQKNYEVHPGYRRYFGLVTSKDVARVLRRIEREGPLGSRDFDTKHKVASKDATFPKPSVAKVAMEYLWRTGKLAVTRRDRREKIYDLTDRVLPEPHLKRRVSKKAYVDWACREALMRLGAATPTRIARFYDAVSTADATTWCRRKLGRELVEVRVGCADGSVRDSIVAPASRVELLAAMPAAPTGLRLLNPFDPLIHDRQRTRTIFGFDYTIEIWVPPKKRKYGYYVLPILEGDRFTGRLDAKVDRKRDRLDVLGLWWEEGVKSTKTRKRRLERELMALAGFVGVAEVAFAKGLPVS